jgi:hypothetical protein
MMPNFPLDGDALDSLREQSDWSPNFHDHRVTEQEWDIAATAVATVETTATEASSTPIERPMMLGTLAFAAFCDEHFDSDDWEWNRNLHDNPRLHHDECRNVPLFTVDGRRVVVVTSTQPFEAANPIHVYGCIKEFEADLYVGGVVDSD